MKIEMKSESSIREGLTGEYITTYDKGINLMKFRNKLKKLIEDELDTRQDDYYTTTFVDFEFKCNIFVNKKEYLRDQKINEILK